MKKSIFVLAGVAMLALASCKKDYTCDCTDVPVLGTVKLDYKKVKKKDAEDECSKAEATYKLGEAKATCTLK